MDYKSFHKLNYGLQIVCSEHHNQKAGYIANTAFQVTSDPPKLAISAHKKNLSTDIIEMSKKFSLSVLKKELDTKIIGDFGFMTSSEIDKFSGLNIIKSVTGSPIVTDHSVAWFDCKVVDQFDVGTHILFIGEVMDAAIIEDAEPLTYAYYREQYKMLSPKNAPTYIPKDKLTSDETKTEDQEEPHFHSKDDMIKVGNKWICTICGWVYDPEQGDPPLGIPPGTPFEELPDDYKCPICNATKEFFIEQ